MFTEKVLKMFYTSEQTTSGNYCCQFPNNPLPLFTLYSKMNSG